MAVKLFLRLDVRFFRRMLVGVEEFKIPMLYNGPAGRAQGGYLCGLMAQSIGGPAKVTLRKPAPLDASLRLEQSTTGALHLLYAGELLAEARPAKLQIYVPSLPVHDEKDSNVSGICFHKDYPYPACFVCGRERKEGLRIFPAPVGPDGAVVASWTPGLSLTDGEGGALRDEFIWAALDCPGGIAMIGEKLLPLLLGRFAVEIYQKPRVGQTVTVVGWPVRVEERKHFAGSALYSQKGELLAKAQSLWIAPKA